MGSIIANTQRLSNLVERLVVLMLHPDRDTTKGLWGHSSSLAATYAVIEVKSGPAGREWQIQKAKDDAGGHSCPFELEAYVVGRDEDDDPIGSRGVRLPLNFATATLRGPTDFLFRVCRQ